MDNKFFNFFGLVSSKKRSGDQIDIQFGKYSDRNKTIEQLEFWKNSLQLYAEGNYLKSSENFLKYIKDPTVNNLEYTISESQIEYNFIQGSKRIFGTINETSFKAHSEILKCENISMEFLELILKKNYELKFCKFIFDNTTQILSLELYLKTSRSNPITLYSALREISITADAYDDMLMYKFQNIQLVNTEHIKKATPEIVVIKIKYFRKWLTKLLTTIDKYDTGEFVGARSFLLLDFAYKTHYLLSPEGELLHEINKIHEIFFIENHKTNLWRNTLIMNIVNDLSKWSDEKLQDSLYTTIACFPVTLPVEPKKIIRFAADEIDKIQWYIDNNYLDIAQSITNYIIGFASFNYGLIPVLNEIFYIYWEVQFHEYFSDLGFKHLIFDKKNINYIALNQLFSKLNISTKKNYPNFNFSIKHLNLNNKLEFAKSYIYELINCDFSSKKI